jgi:hypothetical protein
MGDAEKAEAEEAEEADKKKLIEDIRAEVIKGINENEKFDANKKKAAITLFNTIYVERYFGISVEALEETLKKINIPKFIDHISDVLNKKKGGKRTQKKTRKHKNKKVFRKIKSFRKIRKR